MYTVNKITCNGVPLERFDCVELTGLEPKSDNTAVIRFEAVSPNGKKTFSADKSYSFKTQALELRTENPRVPSLGSAIASATTNISDRETGVGFQWKKYDAPAAVTPGEGYAAVFDGSAEGYIRRELARTLNMRNTPEIRFVLDQSIEYGVNMSKKIDEVTKNLKTEGEEDA